jgi:hypothetical protein
MAFISLSWLRIRSACSEVIALPPPSGQAPPEVRRRLGTRVASYNDYPSPTAPGVGAAIMAGDTDPWPEAAVV